MRVACFIMKTVCIVFAILLLTACTSVPKVSHTAMTNFKEMTGDEWLSMGRVEKLAYVQGYITGYAGAHIVNADLEFPPEMFMPGMLDVVVVNLLDDFYQDPVNRDKPPWILWYANIEYLSEKLRELIAEQRDMRGVS